MECKLPSGASFHNTSLSSATHIASLLGSIWLYCTAATVLVAILWYWYLQNVGVFCCNWTALLPTASHRLSSWCQDSTSLHDSFSTRPATVTEAAPSPVGSPGLSQCQHSAVLHDLSCLQNQYHLGNSYILSSTAAAQGTTLVISGTQLLCVLRKHFPEDFTSVMLVSS